MLNTEHFYSLETKHQITLLKKVLVFQLHKENLVFKHFIQTLQICLTQKANGISVVDFKKLISIHNVMPIYHVPFLTTLMNAYIVM